MTPEGCHIRRWRASMSTVVLKPNVTELQADVIKLLEEVSSLMGRASKALETSRSDKQYAQFQQEIVGEIQKVKHLELRMAIVAPMKAGKSTIVNAIIGQDLLPSRNSAMTTLPTEIAFKANALEPVLVLSSEILLIFEEAYRELKSTVENRGLEAVQGELSEYPHLDQLIQRSQEMSEFPVQIKTHGHKEIIETLTMLNDLIRLSSLLNSRDLLNQLIEVPRIETPFWQSKSANQAEVLGNLVIVDTPGPNEAISNAKRADGSFRLATVVKEQLQKSSVVLIILDFTQLKTEAAEKIRKDVQQVISLRGKENLYVLVNKVDQRMDNDMTLEQVRRFVAAEFGIGSEDSTNRVFEVSARFAFSAANFIQELGNSPELTVSTMKTAEALAQQVYGRKWERELQRAIARNDIEDLRDEADFLWKDSGFDTFVKEAVNALVERAAPKCIKSALNLSQSRLLQLQEDVQLRSKGMAKEADVLQRQVNELEVDLERLNICHTQVKDVNRIKINLHRTLRRTLTKLQEEARVSLATYWDEKEYERADFLGKRGIEARNFANWVQKNLGAEVERGKSVIEFKDESKANEFAHQSINFAKQRIHGLLEEARYKVQSQVESARRELIDQLEVETRPIIEKARQRLNEAFDVILSLPDFSFSSDDPEISRPCVKEEYRYMGQGYETVKVKKRDAWHWLWIVPYEVNENRKRPDKREDYYTVSLEELIKETNGSIEVRIDALKTGINKYIDEDFQDRIERFFEDLDSYLRRYKENLQQSQNVKKLSQNAQEQLSEELVSFKQETSVQREKAASYIQCADDLLEGIK